MEISFSRSIDSFTVHIGYPRITINYEKKLSSFFMKFYNKINSGGFLGRKRSHIESFETEDGFYILSCDKEGEIYFTHKDKATKIYKDDVKAISKAMTGYLDEKYEEHKSGNFTGCGSGFKVPRFYTI